MECKGMKSLVMVMMIIGVVVGEMVTQASSITPSSFKSCYGECFLLCMFKPDQSLCSCSVNCLKDCIFPSPPSKNVHATSHSHANTKDKVSTSRSNTQYYCNLGCATSNCITNGTLHNPSGEAMESCVNSCSKICTNHH